MDKIGFVFVLCFAGAFGGLINKGDFGLKINETCLVEYGINPEILHNENVNVTDEQIYCGAACIYRDYGIMKSDGTIDESKAETYFTEGDTEERTIFFSVYNACRNGNVHCELVRCMFKELKNHWASATESSDITKRFFAAKGLVDFL